MSSEDIADELTTDDFYKSIMTENVEAIRKLEIEPHVNQPLRNVRQIDLPSQRLAILPIHLAATYRKVQSLEALLESGANPELRDQRGRNALHLVITHWPNIRPGWPKLRSKLRVTMETMQQRAEDCLRVLCKSGVDLNARVLDDSRQTALHLAVRFGALPAVGMLASYGADVNLADTIGMTSLHMASGVLHASITECLLQLGADVHRTVYSSGNTPLHLAVRAEASSFTDTHGNSLACISVLLRGGACPNATNHEGRTPLHDACGTGRDAVVDVLLKYGADVNRVSAAGENCLFLFLEHATNLRSTKLLGKLLHLTLPLKLTNGRGDLPKCLELPRYRSQAAQLTRMCQEPRELKSLCKIRIHQLYTERDRPALDRLLPKIMMDFLFEHWECPPEVVFATGDDSEFGFMFRSDFIPPLYQNVRPPNPVQLSNLPTTSSTPQQGNVNNNAPSSGQPPSSIQHLLDHLTRPQAFENLGENFSDSNRNFARLYGRFANFPEGAEHNRNTPTELPNVRENTLTNVQEDTLNTERDLAPRPPNFTGTSATTPNTSMPPSFRASRSPPSPPSFQEHDDSPQQPTDPTEGLS